MRLAVVLERFVIACISRTWHHEAELRNGAHELPLTLPLLDSYPQDTDWRSLDRNLAERALAFRNEIEAADEATRYEAHHESNRVGAGSRTMSVGLTAWDLARDLRRKYGLAASKVENVEVLREHN
jgi:hypothetical protein